MISVGLFHLAHGLDEGADFVWIFLAWFALDPGRNIHAPRPQNMNRFLHVTGMKPTGHDQLADAVYDASPRLYSFPVEGLTRPASPVRGGSIE